MDECTQQIPDTIDMFSPLVFLVLAEHMIVNLFYSEVNGQILTDIGRKPGFNVKN